MNPMQSIIKRKPTAFARRFGIPVQTVKDWSRGKSLPPPWVIALIVQKLNPKNEFKCIVDQNFKYEPTQ